MHVVIPTPWARQEMLTKKKRLGAAAPLRRWANENLRSVHVMSCHVRRVYHRLLLQKVYCTVCVALL